MADEPQHSPAAQGPNVLAPYFVIERPTEGGPGVFTDEKHTRVGIRALFGVIEMDDLNNSTLWRSLGSQGLVIQALATAFINNPGMFEAVGSMMNYLATVAERSRKA